MLTYLEGESSYICFSRLGVGKPLAQGTEMLERQLVWKVGIHIGLTPCAQNSGPIS